MQEPVNNESTLVLELRAGSPGAYRALYERYAPRLQAFSMRFRLSGKEADEIVQETFIRVWLHRDKIDPAANFSAFLVTIARNLIYNQIRHSVTREKYRKEFGRTARDHEFPADGELQRLINNALTQLPERCRQVFRKSRLEGYSNAQIAEEMNISKSTVENQLNKALKLIRKTLENNGYGSFLYFFLFFFNQQ